MKITVIVLFTSFTCLCKHVSINAPRVIFTTFFLHQILTAQVSDTGRYVCAAENVAGSAEKTFNLNVHGELLPFPFQLKCVNTTSVGQVT